MSKCNLPCDVYSRITGYFAPVRLWNRGKREEFRDRKSYSLETSCKAVPHSKSAKEGGK